MVNMRVRFLGFLFVVFIGKSFGCVEEPEANGSLSLHCSNMLHGDHLKDLGENNGRVTRVKIENSIISRFENYSFHRYPNIEILTLDHIEVSVIPPGELDELKKLKELYINNNKLVNITNGVYNSLSSLEKLGFQNNLIRYIEEQAFSGLFSLTDLNLKKNRIAKLEPNVFKNLTSLNILHLSENPFSEIDLASLPKSLIVMEVSMNKALRKIDGSFPLPSMVEIEAVQNDFRILEKPFFTQARMLQRLKLSENKIASIDKNYFRGLPHLKKLNLGDNELTTINPSLFGDLKELEVLELGSNNIITFFYGTFDNLTELRELYLGYNRIRILPQYTFHPLVNLKILDIDGNHLHHLNIDDLLAYSGKLEEILIRSEGWDCKSTARMYDICQVKNIKLRYQGNYTHENIHGIGCSFVDYEIEYGTPEEKLNYILELSDIDSIFNENFNNSLFFRYFQDEFDQTAFVKALRKFKGQ